MSKSEILDSIGLVLRDVVAERLLQEQKWGVQNHKQLVWLGILAEEFGEVAKAINELHFRRAPNLEDCNVAGILSISVQEQIIRVRAELIQVAAVAVAMVESLERNHK